MITSISEERCDDGTTHAFARGQKISIHPYGWRGRSVEELARTIVHEGVHAEDYAYGTGSSNEEVRARSAEDQFGRELAGNACHSPVPANAPQVMAASDWFLPNDIPANHVNAYGDDFNAAERNALRESAQRGEHVTFYQNGQKYYAYSTSGTNGFIRIVDQYPYTLVKFRRH